MLKLSYDLHIHSCLSPCGHEDMTPANIVGMAKLKALDVIAVTDHNSCKNSPAVLSYAKQNDMIAIPGMELCTIEEVHVLCLFPELSDAMDFDAYVASRLLRIKNDEDIFGKQEIYDEYDRIIGTEPYLLINATEIAFDELGKLMEEFRGVYVPAHINKNSNSVLSNLGFIPPDSNFMAAELSKPELYEEISSRNPYLRQCRMITNSDAHTLDRINEAEHFLDCEDRSTKAVIAAIIRKL